MKGIRYILILLTLCVAVVSCEREDGQHDLVHESARLIQFSAESEWHGVTKSAIGSLSDLKDDGFVVWANWTKDPNDNSDYLTSSEEVVFGPYGTIVTASDDGDNIFQPNSDSDDKWVCESEQEWNRGYYNFAAILPASEFEIGRAFSSGRLTSSFSKTQTNISVTTEYSSLITLDVPNSGFDLSSDQVDLMYAFHNEDNSAENSSTVNLDFAHAFSLINIQLSYKKNLIPYVNKVTVYGIHSKIFDDFIFRKDVTIVGNKVEEVHSNNISELLQDGHISTQEEPYVVYTYAQSDFKYSELESINIVENLLVFPEKLSQQLALHIEIECMVAGRSRTLNAEVKSGSWNPGNTYTYLFDATSIKPY